MQFRGGTQAFSDGIDFLARRSAPEAEADHAQSHFLRDAHRLKHGDGSVRPEWHAEPVEAATPSSPFNISAPMQLIKETLSVFGRPNVFCDLNVRQRAASATAHGR